LQAPLTEALRLPVPGPLHQTWGRIPPRPHPPNRLQNTPSLWTEHSSFRKKSGRSRDEGSASALQLWRPPGEPMPIRRRLRASRVRLDQTALLARRAARLEARRAPAGFPPITSSWAGDCFNESATSEGGRVGAVPRRPVFPATGIPNQRAVAARPPGGHPQAYPTFGPAALPEAWQTRARGVDAPHPANDRLQLAGQCPGTSERAGACDQYQRRPHAVPRRRFWHESRTGCASRGAHDGEMERKYIEEILVQSKGRIAGPGGVAELLGLHQNTLRGRIAKLGVKRPS
jgi:hypothetical protein